MQARPSLEETRALLEFADENEWILGVVGWAPLQSSQIERVLEELSGQKKLKALRHVVQGEAEGFLESATFNLGISALRRFDWAYDLLIFERQLSESIRFVDRHPNQIFVLDHLAKPRIQEGLLQPWKRQIRELARRENVFCKVLGMVTEANWLDWTPQTLQPFFDAVLEAFGPSRLMFGSDWPVALVACPYVRWAQIVRDFAAPLSGDEQNEIFQTSARRAYSLA